MSLRRFLLFVVCVGFLVNCETSGGLIGGGVGAGGAPTGNQRTELMLSMEDEAEALAAGFTLVGQGLPPGFTAPVGCPTTTGTTADDDTDGILDADTLTFANPPCTFAPVRGGTFDVVGELAIRDTSTDTTTFNLGYTDLAWTGTDPAVTRTFTATRNGTRIRSGTDSTATLASDLTISRQRPGRATATIDLVTTATFTADSDTVRIGDPLPGGGIVVTGTFQWQRSTENWALTVATPAPLHYEPTCTTTPQRVDSGTVTLSGTVSGVAGVLSIIWDGCGVDPTTTWVRSP